MKAWGFISRTPSSHHRNALDARSAMPPAMFTFRNIAFLISEGKCLGNLILPESRPFNIGNEEDESYSPACLIRENSRLVVRLTRQSSSTAATARPMMNPVQMPRAPMAGTIQSVRARM